MDHPTKKVFPLYPVPLQTGEEDFHFQFSKSDVTCDVNLYMHSLLEEEHMRVASCFAQFCNSIAVTRVSSVILITTEHMASTKCVNLNEVLTTLIITNDYKNS